MRAETAKGGRGSFGERRLWRAGAPVWGLVAAAVLALAGEARAQVAGASVIPIPEDPMAGGVPELLGDIAEPDRIQAPRIPRHPFMAPNGRSNIHNDAYMSDVYRRLGPLGNATETRSTLFFRECGSVAFDSRGRLITICVGLEHPVLAMLDPRTLASLATFDLPLRDLTQGNPFTNFAGGGYFYLDHRDRAVIPTNSRHVFVVRQTDGPGFELARDYDLTESVPLGDAIVSVLPDWEGRLWLATTQGRVGWIERGSGRARLRELGERIHNSFAVDETGGVFIVSDPALYRFEARRREVRVVWRRPYANVGVVKPGQTQAGSGTTPTLMDRRYVAITDNADPMHVLVARRGGGERGGERVCREGLFEPGASATDQSLIATGRSIVAENNHGYTGPAATMNGGVTTPGLQRVDLDRDGSGCHTVWRSRARAPSVVPKLSLGAGLVYTYTKPRREDDEDAWYLTAVDFDTGRTVYRRLAGTGFGYNNNYAPVTIGPGRTAYVGVLGGLTLFRDG